MTKAEIFASDIQGAEKLLSRIQSSVRDCLGVSLENVTDQDAENALVLVTRLECLATMIDNWRSAQ